MCAALVACAGSAEPGPPTSIRTREPQDYKKTITSYFAFRIRGPQKNAEIIVDKPEPGDCLLDGNLSSRRGWVVPVVYATHTGQATGREVVQINTKQYYFWFLGDTIAGITPRLESCPGTVAMIFEDPPPVGVAKALAVAAPPPLPRRPGASGRDGPDLPEQSKGSRAHDRTHAAAGRKYAAYPAKKTGTSSAKVRPAAKTARGCADGPSASAGSEACLGWQAAVHQGQR